jgi:isoquinoline 1-oxidoreductase subunit beta
MPLRHAAAHSRCHSRRSKKHCNVKSGAIVSRLSRRALIGASGLAVTVSFLPACTAIKSFPVIPSRPMPKEKDAHGWIRYADGVYDLYVPRAEMGQHIGIALAMIASKALGVQTDEINILSFNTQQINHVKATVGSDSVKDFAQPLKLACEALRAQISMQSKPAAQPSKAKAPLFGRSLLTGGAWFAGDVRRANMVYGRVLRAPVSPEFESKPVSYNANKAKAEKGFVQLIEHALLKQSGSMGLGIIASTPGALDRIEASLNVQWQVIKPDAAQGQAAQLNQTLDVNCALSKGGLRHAPKKAALDAAAPWAVDLTVTIPMAAHASIEPRCAVAEYTAQNRKQNADTGSDHLTLWVGSQDPFYQRDVMVKRLGLTKEAVLVHAQRLGGGFGGKTIATVELEAAVLSRACGLPVKVQWTRAQEFLQAFHRPPSNHRIRVGLKDSKINAWWHAFHSSHILFTSAIVPPWVQSLTDFIGDDGVARGSQLVYDVKAQRIEFDALRLPVHTGPWRSLGAGPNALALESAIDEAAWVAKQDPLLFRLAHLNSPNNTRVRGVLNAVAEQSEWRKRFSPTAPNTSVKGLRVGYGVACGSYKGASYAAVVSRVEVNREGAVNVTDMWCAHDCGTVIHTDGVVAQVEGNLVWCVGMVLYEQLSYADFKIEQSNFVQSPIPLMGQVPRMHVRLIDAGNAPTGAGETAMIAGAAAIANAIKTATGKRVLQFPAQTSFLARASA